MVQTSRLAPVVASLAALLVGLGLPAVARAQEAATVSSASRPGFRSALEALAAPSSASLARLTPASTSASGVPVSVTSPSPSSGSASPSSATCDAPTSQAPATGGVEAPARPALEARRATGRLFLVERGETDAATLARLDQAVTLLRAGKSPAASPAGSQDASRLEVYVVVRWRERAAQRLHLVSDPTHAADLERLRRSPGATVSLAGVGEPCAKGAVASLRDWKLLALSTDERLAETRPIATRSANKTKATKPATNPETDEDVLLEE